MNCARCQYDLTGLPEVHTCPECGLPYDLTAKTLVLCEGKKDSPFWPISLLAIFTALFWLPLGRGITTSRPHELYYYAFVAVICTYELLRTPPKKRTVTITYDSLRLDPPYKGTASIPWNDIGAARTSGVDGALLILDRQGKKLARTPNYSLKRKQMEELLEMINIKAAIKRTD